jgi:gentisate 1,2-dioxygenase
LSFKETTMNELGTLADLPADYLQDLQHQNLVPLWPSLRSLLPPGQPRPATKPAHWSYEALRPLLMRAGELTPIEKAERRVLVLSNPGHGPGAMQASAAMYLGMQLLLPGEWAPSHRHTPNAVRLVVEGEGAYTTVDGHKLPMSRGDLILTPTGLWHEHGHDGDAAVVWLDVLDLPLVHYLEASYHVDGARQAVKPPVDAPMSSGLRPAPRFERTPAPYPMLRYPWHEARAALCALAAQQPELESVQVAYVNPETGGDAQAILGFSALMLRPGQRLALSVRSPATVLHLIEGAATLQSDAGTFALAEADTACVPGFSTAALANASAAAPAFFFLADEAPLHRKLGLLEHRS